MPDAIPYLLLSALSSVIVLPGCNEQTPSPAGTDTGSDSDSTGETNGDASSTGGSPASEGVTTASAEDAAAVLYFNFDGAVLGAGDEDDATNDLVGVSELVGTWDSLGPILANPTTERLGEVFEPFPVRLTRTRPEEGDYTMVVVTASPPPQTLGSAVTIAPTDCENANPNNVVLVFAAGLSEAQIVHAIAYGVGISFGLDPVGSETDVMDPVVDLAEQRAFESACEPLSTVVEPACRSTSSTCPEGSQSSFDAFMEALSGGG